MSSQDDVGVILRDMVKNLPPYRQGRSATSNDFKLSSNENPFPPLDGVIEAALRRADFNRYPEAGAPSLTRVLADRFHTTPDRIHIGAGSISILAELIHAVAEAGDEVVYAWRSFEAYPTLVTISGADSVRVPLTETFEHDLDAMAEAITASTRLVIICSPNNPTGPAVSDREFRAFMAKVPATVLVVLDEAYREFVTDEDAVDGQGVIDDYSNLVLLRTFSKAYGLAGLRIGYAVGQSRVLDAARLTQIPLSVIGIAESAAIASLRFEDVLRTRIAQIVERRNTLVKAVRSLGIQVPDTESNFIWIPAGIESSTVGKLLEERGIIARVFAGDGVRISIGEAESLDSIVAAMVEARNCLPGGDMLDGVTVQES